MTQNTTTDVIIIGAGPAGLYAAFTLGLQGFKSHIVDALPHAGGQCIQHFADKLIYDIPAIQACTGHELIKRLQAQALVFKPQYHLGRLATQLSTHHHSDHVNVGVLADMDTDTQALPLHTLTLDDQSTLTAPCIIIASGAGAFVPRKPAVMSENPLPEKALQQVFYHPANPNHHEHVASFAGKHILISGDLEETLQTANQLAKLEPHQAASITLVHRRDKFRAEEHTIAQTEQLRTQGKIHFIAGQLKQLHTDASSHQLSAISIQHSADQSVLQVPADALFILHGLSPQASNYADWGLATKGKLILVDTATYQTNMQGIFAVGDAITYLGKRQLIVSGFHEATMASYGIASYLQDGKKIPQLYTTSSTKLQKLLGEKD